MAKNVLITNIDSNYVDAAKQLFSSVYYNAGWQGDYLLLATGVPEEQLGWFRDRGIHVYECEPLISNSDGRWPVAIASSLYLFSEYFKRWDKILFLDSDIIVRASLDSLLRYKGVASAIFFTFKKLKIKIKIKLGFEDQWAELTKKYNLNSPVFGMAVNVIDTSIITKDTLDNLKSFLKYESIAVGIEELVLSLYFYRRWKKINQFYNLIPHFVMRSCWLRPEKIRGAVLHFIGKNNKPWISTSPFYLEWKSNFDKADLIDLSNRPMASKKWSQISIYFYVFYLYLRFFLCLPIFFINWSLGQIGIIINKVSPRAYRALKRIIR